AGARQPRQDRHRQAGVFVGVVGGVAAGSAEVPEPRVVGGERARRVQAALLGAVLPVQGDVVQQLGGVGAHPAQDVGGRQQHQVVVAGQQADTERDPLQVGTLQR